MTSLPRRQPVRNNSSAVFYQDLVPRHQPLGFDSSAAFSLLHPQRRLLGSTPTSIGPSTSIFGPMLLCEGPSDSNPWRAPSGLGCLAVVSQWLLLGDTPSSLSQVCHRRSHAHGQVTLKTLRPPPPLQALLLQELERKPCIDVVRIQETAGHCHKITAMGIIFKL